MNQTATIRQTPDTPSDLAAGVAVCHNDAVPAAPTAPSEAEEEKAQYIRRWSTQLAQMLKWAGDLNQAWLVRETGIDQTTVNKWLNGARGPNVHHLKKIAKAFKLTLAELLEWSPDQAPKVRSGTEATKEMLTEERIPARIETFLAARADWLSEFERKDFMRVVLALRESSELDLTDAFLQRLASAIKFGHAESGTD